MPFKGTVRPRSFHYPQRCLTLASRWTVVQNKGCRCQTTAANETCIAELDEVEEKARRAGRRWLVQQFSLFERRTLFASLRMSGFLELRFQLSFRGLSFEE